MNLRTLSPIILLVALASAPLSGTAIAQTTETVTVHLEVETHVTERAGEDPGTLPGSTPGTAVCDVEVADGADGGNVLDAAVANGCIASWDHTEFDGDRFVTEIDRLEAPGLTCLAFAVGVCDFWEYHVNGTVAGFGIDGYSAEDGDTNRWLYRNTFGHATRP